jgi:hypothetical protein
MMRRPSQLLCPRGPEPRTRPDCCFRPDAPPRLPDPGIYSQFQRFATGDGFTFANPDISKSASLAPSGDGPGLDITKYRVSVSVTNFSDDAPAAGVEVRVDGARWGIGMPRVGVGGFTTDLGIASGLNARVKQTIELDPESGLSRFFVRVRHPKDRDPANNQGIDAQRRENVESGPFSLPFTVRNPLQRQVTVSLAVMNGTWDAAVTPDQLSLLPSQNGVASLAGIADLTGMDPSDRVEFTIIATVEGALLDGLTYRLGPASGD